MPDWMSHLVVALILSEIFNIKKKSLVIFGVLLPDILSKGYLLLFYLDIPNSISFISFHTPFMAFLMSILIVPFFRYNKVKTVLYFNIGCLSHFVIDMLNKHFTNIGTRIFYPLSNKNYSLGMVWPDDFLLFLIPSIIIYLSILIFKKYSKNKY